jgi:hypothetical protein
MSDEQGPNVKMGADGKLHVERKPTTPMPSDAPAKRVVDHKQTRETAPRAAAPDVTVVATPHVDERTRLVAWCKAQLGEKCAGKTFFFGNGAKVKDDSAIYTRQGYEPVVIEGKEMNHLGDPLYMRDASYLHEMQATAAGRSVAGFKSALKGDSATYGAVDAQGKVHAPTVPKD